MVGSIGSIASNLFQQYQNIQSSTEAYTTKQALSFDELIGNGTITNENQSQNENGSGFAIGKSSSSSDSSSYSEMDLNRDGTVTIDEILRYTEMQMAEKMTDQIASDEGSSQMSEKDNDLNQNIKESLNNFKTKMATQAYKIGESLISTSIGAVTQNFVL